MSLECWFTQDAHTCIFGQPGWGGVIGEGVLAMFITAGLIAALYSRTGDYIISATMLVFISGAAAQILPGILASIAWTMVFMSVAVAMFSTLYRTVIQ